MKKNNVAGTFGLGLLALSFLAIPSALAIGIQPVRHEVEAKPGETLEGSVTVVNETEEDFKAEPYIQVFYRNDENGFPVFDLTDRLEIEDIASWLDIPQEPILVKAGETASVQYKVVVPQNAEPGGKYIAIGYKPVQEREGMVAINVVAASLLLINVAGDVTKTGELINFSLPEIPDTSQPFQFYVDFKNTGNTHLKPHGKIEITDLETGKKLSNVAKYIDPDTGATSVSDFIPVNLNKTNVLPDSTRLYKPEWSMNLKTGRFEALLSLEYAPDTPAIEETLEFEINEKMILESFELKQQEGESGFEIQVRNEGEAAQSLKGSVFIENIFGYQMDEIEIPMEWEAVKPGEAQTYYLKWLEGAMPEGRYSALLDARYGYTQQALKGEVSFGKMDTTVLALIIAVVILACLTLFLLLRRRKKE